MNDVQLYLGDCLEVMATLPDRSIDAIITDLPYGASQCKWDNVIPFDSMWEQIRRILKSQRVFVTTAIQPFTSKLIVSNLDWFRYTWIWEKERPSNFFSAKFAPLNNTEDIAVFSDGGCNTGSKFPMKYTPQGTVSVNRVTKNYNTGGKFGKEHRTSVNDGRLYHQTTTGYPKKIIKFNNDPSTDHPTQKPVALFGYLIETYTDKGDTVLDFAMGSGTTGVAAVNTGRNFVGCDNDADYFAIAQKRIAEAQRQLEKVMA